MRHIALNAIALVLLGLTVLIFSLPEPQKHQGHTNEATLYITNASLLQNGQILEGQTIKIEDGLIANIESELSIPPQSRRLDGRGLIVLPGLIDAHTHSYGTARSDALRFGVTANLDMFTSMIDLLSVRFERDTRQEQKQADLFSAGMMATAPRGHGTQYGLPIETLEAPDDAKDWVKARKAEGSDYIKLVYMPYQNRIPSLSRPIAKAVIDAAHAEGLMTVAHISSQKAARDMIEDNIDGLVHIFADSVASPDLIRLASEKGIFIIPTLSVIASVDGQNKNLELSEKTQARLSPMQRQTFNQKFPHRAKGFHYETALKNTKALHDAGVLILAGSDAPNPGTAHGISLHLEMQHLVRAGLSPKDALLAATQMPAKAFGLMDRGRIEVGQRADIVLISGNPIERIADTVNVEHVIKNGFLLENEPRPSPSKSEFSGNRLADFKHGLDMGEKLRWSATDDGMANGQSNVIIELNGPSLKVFGEVNSGFSYPWAGVSISTDINGEALDISRFKSVSFAVKGTAGEYRLMAFQEDAMGIPPSQSFQISQDWTTIKLPLTGFAGFDEELFTGFAFVAGPEPTRFEFHLRDVTFLP